MRDYELMLAFSPEGGDEGFPGALAQVSQSVIARSGEVVTTLTNPPWGHRRLAYPIRDFRDAYYAVLHLNLDPAQVTSLERDLHLNEKVLRFIVVRRDDAMKAEAKAASRRPAPQPEVIDAEEEDDAEGPE